MTMDELQINLIVDYAHAISHGTDDPAVGGIAAMYLTQCVYEIERLRRWLEYLAGAGAYAMTLAPDDPGRADAPHGMSILANNALAGEAVPE